MTPDVIPARYRTAVYVAAAVVAAVLVVVEVATDLDAADLVARAGVLFAAILAVVYRPTRPEAS